MKKIVVGVMLLAVAVFACSKKLEYKGFDKMPYMLVNIDYNHIDGDCANIEEWNESPKFYRNNGYKGLYYSSLDSNVLVFLSSVPNDPSNMAMYFIRTCQSNEECEAQASKKDILETFKYEFMRLQKNGAYNVSEEYADSVSNHIIDKLREYKPLFEGDSTYSFVYYNSQCFSSEYKFRDEVTEGGCYDYPEYFTEEIDSCNAYLESLEALPLMLARTVEIDFQTDGKILSIASTKNMESVSILSPLGRLLEKHAISGLQASFKTRLPAGSYIAIVKTRAGSFSIQFNME